MKLVGSNRRLAAIMFTDMVGYSALTEGDETLGLELLEEHRAILRHRLAEFAGQEVKSTGDGFLVEFASVIDAVQCAIQVQTALFERNLTVPEERRVRIRIGLHLGDIVDTEADRHGNGVNVAARIEPYATAGGIAVSRQVVDQIRGRVNLPLRKLGRLPLKNLESPPEVFRIVLPWEPAGRGRAFVRALAAFREWGTSLRSPANASVAVSVLGALVTGALLAGAVFSARHGSRAAAEILPDRWEVAVGAANDARASWRPFDPGREAGQLDEIRGEYRLRLRFPTEKSFDHPTLVLGLVSDRHEAYLNGAFIGGATGFSEFVAYNLGTSLREKENELVIRAETRPTLTPGLYRLPGIAPQIGEFASITALVDAHRFSMQVVQTVYLAICLLTAFASLLYAVFRRRRKHFYSALFLAMGALGVSFYNSFAIQSLDYRTYRFLNLLAYAGSLAALFSMDLGERGRRKLETANNLGALAFAGVAAAALLAGELRPTALLFRLEVLFGVVLVYAAVVAVSAWRPAKEASRAEANGIRVFATLLLGVVAAIFLGKAGAAFGWSVPNLSPAAYDVARRVSILVPIGFALAVFTRAISDYVRKSIEIGYKKRKDELILGLASVVAREGEYAETVRLVQARVADFLNAARSTIYLLDDSGKTLRAEFLHGSASVKSAVEATLDAEAGIVGHCLSTRAPVWVEDIARDERFASGFRERLARPGEPRTYRTGSFILAPIQVGRRVYGVITIADRKDGLPFTAEDFCLVHLASRDLSLVLSQLKSSEGARLRLVA